MSTRSSARNLFPPLDNPELTIQRRSRIDPTLLNDFEMAINGNGDPPVPDLRTIEELCQPTLNGRGGPHLDKFLHVTQSIKVNGVTGDALHLYLFPYSLTHHATTWFDCLPRNSINIFEQMAKVFLGKYFPPSMVTKLINEITNFRQHTFYNGLTLRHRDTINAAAGGTFMKRRPEECYDLIENMTAHHNDWDTFVQRSESSSSITSSSDPEIIALKAEMAKINKNIMKVLQINQQVKEVAHNCETCGDPHSYNDFPATVGQTQNVYATGAYNQGDVHPPIVKIETPIPNFEPVAKPVVVPVSALKPNLKPSIPYPSRLHNQKLRDKANDQKEKFFQIFQDLNFNISFADALIVMPNASINLMPLFVCNKLSLPKLSPTCMTLELMDRSISRPVRVAEDVFVKVGTFHFSADFVVVDFDADPRVLLILRRSFLKTKRALIDVYKGELNLRVGKEAVTFNLDQTLRYFANYDAMSVNRTDLIDVACEECSQEVLGFFVSGNPTPSTEPIVSNSSPTLTPFGDSDFLLKETDAFLAIDDEPISPKIDDRYYDSEGDILLPEEFINDDPSSPPLPPQELKIVEPTNEKSSIDEPPVVELKDLPPHLEYAFLEGDDKLPVIISKDLKDEEKTALIKVLKSHKQALAWKLSDIKGIALEFCTHKILMEDDFKPAVQHQRRVNPKIHEVIKKEVLGPPRSRKDHSRVPTERLPIVACLLAYAMYRARSKDTFYNGLTLRHRDTINAAAGETFMKRRLEECYDLIENTTAHHNDWDTSAQWSESSSSITSSSDMEIEALKAKMVEINKNLMRILQVNQQVKAVTPSCETYVSPYSFNDCPATVGQTQNVYVA
nr:DNA-directed DNA polymerase [Tanacetum cinerariifolium]